MKFRLVNGTDTDFRAGIFLAKEAHSNTVFRDIVFSEEKARTIFESAINRPDRNGLIYATPNVDAPLQENGLYGFASVRAGEYFLGSGGLIATVQTLNVSDKISGTLLGGKVSIGLVKALRHWANARGCEHLLIHVTNGVDAARSDGFFRRLGFKTVGGNYVD
ncbi:hypothetical protein [uncultured Roseibium sp.]|uniref:hypothetical protein n=1 Tax=uncultured Roseibium sp. TaxID=1936171 RepID=UPI00261FBE00|nr:hypothetical protein [uncultured Roseibium sp.]